MSGGSPDVRDASEHDAEACAAIYAPYVTDTAITFDSDPPAPAQMAQRIATAVRTHAWVVLEDEGRVVGYAYSGPFMSRAAYRWSCEVSVYLERGRRRTGGGRALYNALFARLAERGFRTAVAGMALPNDASVGLHRAMGSSRSEPTGGSVGNRAGGTTSPGSSGRSPAGRIRPPSSGDVHRNRRSAVSQS
jgi:L-amino acid N-acyltransferase YncA